MAGWTRAELETAFTGYQQQVREAQKTRNWTLFADMFTPDALYVEHAYGTMRGTDQIRDWVISTMTSAPGRWMVGFPPAWHVIDEERGRIVCEIRNIMSDPGDGSVHEASNLTILGYAGDGLFDYEEDVYNPARFVTMVEGWAQAALHHGGLPDGAAEWLDAAIPRWRNAHHPR
jgi:hypothetical protein